MGRIKLFLDVIEDMRSLAVSLEIMANAMMDVGSDAYEGSEATVTEEPDQAAEPQPDITLIPVE